MVRDLGDAELAGLGALVDEPGADGEQTRDTSATGPAAVAVEADAPATDREDRAARDLVASVDGALWRLVSRSVPIQAGASFDDLITVRERALNRAKADPAGTT